MNPYARPPCSLLWRESCCLSIVEKWQYGHFITGGIVGVGGHSHGSTDFTFLQPLVSFLSQFKKMVWPEIWMLSPILPFDSSWIVGAITVVGWAGYSSWSMPFFIRAPANIQKNMAIRFHKQQTISQSTADPSWPTIVNGQLPWRFSTTHFWRWPRRRVGLCLRATGR